MSSVPSFKNGAHFVHGAFIVIVIETMTYFVKYSYEYIIMF